MQHNNLCVTSWNCYPCSPPWLLSSIPKTHRMVIRILQPYFFVKKSPLFSHVYLYSVICHIAQHKAEYVGISINIYSFASYCHSFVSMIFRMIHCVTCVQHARININQLLNFEDMIVLKHLPS